MDLLRDNCDARSSEQILTSPFEIWLLFIVVLYEIFDSLWFMVSFSLVWWVFGSKTIE